MAEYVYSLNSDFNNQINVDNLFSEISNVNLSAELENITVLNGSVTIIFDEELQSSEIADLEDLFLSHDFNSYTYAPNCYPDCCTGVNYNFLGLHKEEIIDDLGFLSDVNMYSTIGSGGILSGIVVNDHYEYYLGDDDLVDYRTETVTWYKTNGNIYAQKIWTKYYNLQEAIKEGRRRRDNLIQKAKTFLLMNVQGMHNVSGDPIMPNSYYLYTLCKNEIDLYIAGMKDCLIEFFENTAESYVTEEIRNGVLDIIKYWSG